MCTNLLARQSSAHCQECSPLGGACRMEAWELLTLIRMHPAFSLHGLSGDPTDTAFPGFRCVAGMACALLILSPSGGALALWGRMPIFAEHTSGTVPLYRRSCVVCGVCTGALVRHVADSRGLLSHFVGFVDAADVVYFLNHMLPRTHQSPPHRHPTIVNLTRWCRVC